MKIYRQPEETPVGTLFLVWFIIVVLTILVSFSSADGSTALTASGSTWPALSEAEGLTASGLLL